MPDDDLLASVLAHVGELLERGEDVDVDALVSEYPELGARIRRAIDAERLLDAAFEGAEPSEHRIPEQIGPYRVLSRLGSGGMGTVYLAETRAPVAGREPGEQVALKIVHPHLLERPGFFKRFLREAESGRRVDDPHVVRTLDADAVRVGGDTVHFIVMEYVEGQTLAELLRDLQRVPEALIREIAVQAAAGLAAIHAAGLVHRDLKPENILITPDHRVRLMDLGVARPLAAESALTEQGAFAGSLPYAAPEQFAGADVGPAVDLYALGVTLYELATAVNPFRRDDLAAVMAAHREHVPQPVCDVVEDVSPFLSELVATLLAKTPEQRLTSAAELASVLGEGERSPWWQDRATARAGARRPPVVPVRRETVLHGREADLDSLRSAWESAVSGRGRVLLLEGEAGIGKSRLVDAFLREVNGVGAHVLYGSYSPTGGLGGVSDAILEHFGEHALAGALAPYLEASPALVPPFAAMVRHEPPPEGAQPLSSAAIQTVLVRLMQGLARERPLIWVVDDLHFADHESRAVLLSMARAVERHRVLLVATSRPGLPEDWLAHATRLEPVERRSLARLSAREVIELLQDAFKSEMLADKLGARIALKSDGIPFFVFEMIRGLRDGQFITRLPDGTYVETRLVDQIEVPSAVRDLVEARLRGLTDEDRELLDVAAVQGFTFDAATVASVLGRDTFAVLRRLAAIERRLGIVVSAGSEYRFDHHQLQEVLYEDVPEQLRRECHSRVAQVLSNVVSDRADQLALVARHELLGTRPEEVAATIERALQSLSDSYLTDEVVSLSDLALDTPGALSEGVRGRVLRRRADALGRVGRLADAVDCAGQATTLLTDPTDGAELARAWIAAGWNSRLLGRPNQAKSALERALEVTGGLDHVDALTIEAQHGALNGLGAVYLDSGDPAGARKTWSRALQLAQEHGATRLEPSTMQNLSLVLRMERRFDEALELLDGAMALARATGDLRSEALAANNRVAGLWLMGRLEDAVHALEDAQTLVRGVGDRVLECSLLGNRSMLMDQLGRWDEATSSAERCLSIAEEMHLVSEIALAMTQLGHISAQTGHLGDARKWIEQALEWSTESHDPYRVRACLVEQVRIALWLGDLDGAERITRELIQSGDVLGGAQGDAGRRFLPRVLAERGRTDAALAAAEQAAEGVRPNVDAHVGATLRVLASCLIDAGRSDDARRVLEQTAALRGGKSDGASLHQLQLEARLGGDSVDEFRRLFDAARPRLAHFARMQGYFDLWTLGGAVQDLSRARRLLYQALEHAPSEYHESMCQNVRVNREILAAWREEFGDEGEGQVRAESDSDDEPDASESATRIVPRE